MKVEHQANLITVVLAAILIAILYYAPKALQSAAKNIHEARVERFNEIAEYDLDQFKMIGKISNLKTYDNNYRYQQISSADKNILIHIKQEEVPLDSSLIMIKEKRVDVYCFLKNKIISLCRTGKEL